MSAGVVYRMHDAAGRLLYIGSSICWLNRLSQHRDKGWWQDIATVSLEHFAAIEDALMAEAAAIREENPKHNAQRRRAKIRNGRKAVPDFNVKVERLNRGLTQSGLAQAVSMSRETIRAFENGEPGLVFNVRVLATCDRSVAA